MRRIKSVLLVCIVFLGRGVLAQLPANYQPNTDWLIDNSGFKAKIVVDKQKNKITLSNGLISRTFLLKPSLTTVRFDNLMTGETVIRAINPEAKITIDKQNYSVGGLDGQKDRAFLQDEWIDQLTPPPNGLTLFNIEQGVPKERFAWKRVRHHAPHATWPPKGVYLRLDFHRSAPSAKDLAAVNLPSAKGRKTLIKDDFTKMDAAWKIHVFKKDQNSSFVNEGKPGEIYTPVNTAVYAERPLPKDTRLIEVSIDPGDDKGASWGPGLSLVWPKRTMKFYIRPEGGNQKRTCFVLWNGRREIFFKKGPRPNLSVPNTLRARISDGKWKLITSAPLSKSLGAPIAVRIGKTDAHGGDKNHRRVGDSVRLRIEHFAAYSDLLPAFKKQLMSRVKTPTKKDPVTISLHYELYDGVPLMSKWITVRNDGKRAINVDRFTAEELSLIEYDNPVMGGEWPLRRSNMVHAFIGRARKTFVRK